MGKTFRAKQFRDDEENSYNNNQKSKKELRSERRERKIRHDMKAIEMFRNPSPVDYETDD